MSKIIYWDGVAFTPVDELQTAEDTTILDTGEIYSASNVEAALTEIDTNISTVNSTLGEAIQTTQSDLSSFAIAMAIGLS